MDAADARTLVRAIDEDRRLLQTLVIASGRSEPAAAAFERADEITWCDRWRRARAARRASRPIGVPTRRA